MSAKVMMSLRLLIRRGREGAWRWANCIPRPPTISTEGFPAVPVEEEGGGTASPIMADADLDSTAKKGGERK